MTVNSLATGVAATAALGATTAGVTFGVIFDASATTVSAQVQPVVFGAPLPLDPQVPGTMSRPPISCSPCSTAAAKGSLPLTFNIAPSGAASANITATGPHLAPTTENIMFVDQGGWKLSRTSATTLIQPVQSAGG